jgi:predicted CopG family antitoxin
MATQAQDSSKNASKARRNITISDEAEKQLEEMAKADLRKRSNFISWLIEQEWKRRNASSESSMSAAA